MIQSPNEIWGWNRRRKLKQEADTAALWWSYMFPTFSRKHCSPAVKPILSFQRESIVFKWDTLKLSKWSFSLLQTQSSTQGVVGERGHEISILHCFSVRYSHKRVSPWWESALHSKSMLSPGWWQLFPALSVIPRTPTPQPFSYFNSKRCLTSSFHPSELYRENCMSLFWILAGWKLKVSRPLLYLSINKLKCTSKKKIK